MKKYTLSLVKSMKYDGIVPKPFPGKWPTRFLLDDGRVVKPSYLIARKLNEQLNLFEFDKENLIFGHIAGRPWFIGNLFKVYHPFSHTDAISYVRVWWHRVKVRCIVDGKLRFYASESHVPNEANIAYAKQCAKNALKALQPKKSKPPVTTVNGTFNVTFTSTISTTF